jgi:hypothetical protein
MTIKLRWLIGTAMGLAICAGPALAGTISILPQAGAQDLVDDAGGNSPPWGVPLGLTGYSSIGATTGSPNLVLTAGTYQFTYLGKGNASDHNTFVVSGPGGFTFDNRTTALGTTFRYTVGGTGDLLFTYSNLTQGTSIADSAASSNTIDYALYMAGSHGCGASTNPLCLGGTPLTGPGTTAYIGLADRPFTGGDHDFQDLGVKVASVPEPLTWALMIMGFGGVGAMLRSPRRRQAISRA